MPVSGWRQHRGNGDRREKEREFCEPIHFSSPSLVLVCLNKCKLGLCNLKLEES